MGLCTSLPDTCGWIWLHTILKLNSAFHLQLDDCTFPGLHEQILHHCFMKIMSEKALMKNWYLVQGF